MLDYSVVYSAGDLPAGGHLLSPFNKMKRLRSKHRRFLIVFVKGKPAKTQAQSPFANLKIDAGAFEPYRRGDERDASHHFRAHLEQGKLSDKWLKITFWLAVYGTFANWFGILIAAIFNAGKMLTVAAKGQEGHPVAEAVVTFSLVSLTLAMLFVSVAILIGLARYRKT